MPGWQLGPEPVRENRYAVSTTRISEASRRFDRSDWAFMLVGCVLSFFLASILMTGWPQGLSPNLKYPYIYAGDGHFQFWLSQRAIEGWIFENPRSGFPFGSSFLDFPGSDAGNLLVIKLLGKISGSYFAANNLYLLLGFSSAFAASFLVFRKMDLSRGAAFSGALLFAFLPYHFARLLMGHLFYTWYFVIPIYFYAGFRTFRFSIAEIPYRKWAAFSAALLAASCFGVYFAFFGLIVIAVCGIAGSLGKKSVRPAIFAGAMCAAITTGVLLNVTPNILNAIENGKNTEVAQRSPVESEVYALKLIHLLLPHPQHRIQALGNFTRNYNKDFPLSNTVSALGIVGVLGFASLIAVLFRSMAARRNDPRMRALTLLTLILLLIATVGGLNVLFATLISPMIRGWDRISIFVAFFSIAAFFVIIDQIFKAKRAASLTVAISLLLLTVVGLLDQTASPSYNAALTSKESFLQDQKFVGAIENSLPPKSAIYQIPYLSFPETPNLVSLGGYDLLVGFLNSKQLRWSSGGMKGRQADIFYRELTKRPLREQIDTARALGFSGIYVDGRGYTDGGTTVVSEISQILGRPPSLKRDDGQVKFFTIEQ